MNAQLNCSCLLVDASSFLYRSFHALPPLTNAKGEPTGALLGLLNMLKKCLVTEQPHYVAVVFDSKGPTTRHQLYPAYKANRGPMPDELSLQIEPAKALVQALGLHVVQQGGIEADDLIGTLTHQAYQNGMTVTIATTDKDMAQLVQPQVTLLDTMRQKRMDCNGVMEKFGVRPDQIIDYLALMGDASDNIPGVPMVGKKTAAKLLAQYDDLENLIAHLDQIQGKVGVNLRAAAAKLPMSKTLTTIDCAIEMDQTIDTCKRRSENREALIEHYQRYEFRGHLKELLAQSPRSVASSTQEHTVKVIAESNWATQTDQWQHVDWIAIDLILTESPYTASQDSVAHWVGLSLMAAGQAPIFIVFMPTEKQSKEVVISAWFERLQRFASTFKGLWVAYDFKTICKAWPRMDLALLDHCCDVLLQSYVDESTAKQEIASLVLRHLNEPLEDLSALLSRHSESIETIAVAILANWAGHRINLIAQLYAKLDQDLKSKGAWDYFSTIEMGLLPVLVWLERVGVRIDAACLDQQSQSLGHEIRHIDQTIQQIAGETVNVNSPKQLQELLYHTLKLPIIKKTPAGVPSTSEAVLHQLSDQHPLPELILSYRSLSKLKSTYTDPLPNAISSKTGRIHGQFNQAVTSTGRLSSSHPNLQNIPIRTDAGRRIRDAFVASEGKLLICADYSQIELRIMAHFSQDARLIDAFQSNQDVHRWTASEVFNVALEAVTPLMRRRAKAVNFGLIYGMSAFGLAKQLDIGRQDAAALIERYFERFSGVSHYMEAVKQQAMAEGYVKTLLGRRLRIDGLNDRQGSRKMAALRTAINAPMQGSAADIIKRAMITCHQQFIDDNAVKMILQVHDELVFEVDVDAVSRARHTIVSAMVEAVQLRVPLVVNCAVGQNWGQAHPV